MVTHPMRYNEQLINKQTLIKCQYVNGSAVVNKNKEKIKASIYQVYIL